MISVKDCLLQPELFGKIAGTVLEFVRRNSISVYNESSGKGDMRHLYLRCGQHSGEVMVCFIVRKPIRKKLMPLVEILTEQYPQIKSISMNCNPKKTNVILGDSTETLWGKDTITDTMCGNAVDLSPESFYQVNTIQAERLYGAAKEFAQLTGKERLLICTAAPERSGCLWQMRCWNWLAWKLFQRLWRMQRKMLRELA